MLPSATSAVQPAVEGDHLTPRRIRHVTGVQIRNLTPFPVRDAFTSALAQPAEPSHFSATGATDDLGAILSRKRTRRVSTNSTATRRSLKWDDVIVEQDKVASPETRGRASSGTKITFADVRNVSTSPSKPHSFTTSRSSHSMRSQRARTNSMTSSSSSHLAGSTVPLGSSSTLSTHPFSPGNSQSALERIIGSRLVETFIVVSIPEKPDVDSGSGANPPQLAAPLRSAPLLKSTSPASPPTRKTVNKALKESSLHLKSRSTPPGSAPASRTTFSPSETKKKGEMPGKTVIVNGNGFASSHGKGKSVSSLPIETGERTKPSSHLPVYFSPIHRPSTNPFFPLDPRSGRDIPSRCNVSGQIFKVEAWVRTSLPRRGDEEEKRSHSKEFISGDSAPDWKLLGEWEIDLNKLIALPDDLDMNPSQLPFNTIVITLTPPGRAFYLPSASKTVSRSSSPSAGYTSDPETEIRKVKQDRKRPDAPSDVIQRAEIAPLSRRRRHKGHSDTLDFRDTAKTLSWQELFRLVTLQSCILDNESSVDEVTRKIDGLLEKDEVFPLRREISEREARIQELRRSHVAVVDEVAERKRALDSRAQKLKERAELLSIARDSFVLHTDDGPTISHERNRLTTLREDIHSAQTSLLSTLATIFPIELYSPPDLLFTILDVPLPIPLSSNDPGPPLSLPDHKDVTEDAVATALGYVAQILQILAGYLEKNLVYPVTCIGSRSLIRDGISAMVGPRMFPLFSKGVDTYRFEYGVFLLNKDIEMLMADRDLRALDMRHTLPNLKNLLLTLTHDINAKPSLQPSRIPNSPISSVSGLTTPSRESSPVPDDSTTPKASHVQGSQPAFGSTTPNASGYNTPTAATDDTRKAPNLRSWSDVLGVIGTKSEPDVSDRDKVLIREFISCLIDSSSGLPAPSDDLNATSDQPLATSFALDTVERISEDLYVFKLPPSPSCKWVISVDCPTTVLYICRLVASTPNTHTVLTIAYHLLEHHIPFRTLLLQASSEPEQLNLPYADNANRFNKHQFTTADFNSAMLECRALLGRPQGRAAILRGGIVGRIAREFGSKESGLQGPSIEVTVHHSGYFVPSKHDGYFYWDDDLTGEEIACLCGTYCLYTGRGEQTTTVSWFPPPDVWDKQGYGWPGWTETNEEFFQQWIADIRKGNAKPLSRQNWWRKVHSIKNTRSMLKNNRERAKAYVELNIHAM
ncbi:unnamed protein product [Cyclocybe aegerita]|uniref:Autophagy-related protein 14 n=1 Tax=Cyclocybe aegerita TaxID=1973307 RepID=A0A8S0VX19_CYCAE|nr:unnamed protein product [Cyclocybe aegerita]